MVGKAGFEEAVKRGWDGVDVGPQDSLVDRIARCRKELSKWKKTSNFNSRDRINKLSLELRLRSLRETRMQK
uniref:Uncharacterized protein n=1 Tax=Brassica oleracea TaxID=3712 RepID=A0A3P6DG72_BRAOL|nr:unnamed protein product [Brassica oleracea]